MSRDFFERGQYYEFCGQRFVLAEDFDDLNKRYKNLLEEFVEQITRAQISNTKGRADGTEDE